MSDDKTLLDNIGIITMTNITNGNTWKCPHLAHSFIERSLKKGNSYYDVCPSCVSNIEIRIIHKKLTEMSRLLTITMNKIDKLDLQDTMVSIEEKKSES